MMNLDNFRSAQFERRTARVAVPALSDFFEDGQEPVITVQNLTGPEVFQAEQRIAQNRNIEGIVKALAGEKPAEVIDGVMESLGLTGSVPDALAKAIAYVEFGVASVKLEQEDAVRLAEFYIESFLKLFNEINRLTGLGHVPPGESSASGQTTGCKTPLPCAPEAPEGSDSSSK